MHTEKNLELVDRPESTLSLEPVIDVLEDALHMFAEGNEQQACLRLVEANSVFDCCLTGVTPINVANAKPSRSVGAEEVVEEAVLATA